MKTTKKIKKIISLCLCSLIILSIAVTASADEAYSDEVLKVVYDATKLIGQDVEYSENAKITYGQIAGASVNLFTDEYESSYTGLETEHVFNHQYARAYYALSRDVLKNGIFMQIDNPIMIVNNIEKEIDPGIGTKPIIENSRTLLPIRAVVEEMGGTVGWNNDTREVTLAKDDVTVVLTIDNTTAYLNEEEKELDCAPIIKNGRTLLPIRFIAESFGYSVGWNANERLVSLMKPTAEDADKNATVGDTINALTYYLAKRNNNTISFNKDELLNGEDRNAEITHKQFAQLLCELDDIAGLLVKVEITKSGKTEFIPVKIRKDISAYPANSDDYRVILEEIHDKMYTNKLKVAGDQKPEDNYNFARDYKNVFTDVLSAWVDAAATQTDVDMKITYYPSLVTENGNGHTMRVKIDIISAKEKIKVTDIFNTSDGSSPNIYFEKGKSYFCDFRNNTPKEAIAMNMENIKSLSTYMTISSYYPN